MFYCYVLFVWVILIDFSLLNIDAVVIVRLK